MIANDDLAHKTRHIVGLAYLAAFTTLVSVFARWQDF